MSGRAEQAAVQAAPSRRAVRCRPRTDRQACRRRRAGRVAVLLPGPVHAELDDVRRPFPDGRGQRLPHHRPGRPALLRPRRLLRRRRLHGVDPVDQVQRADAAGAARRGGAGRRHRARHRPPRAAPALLLPGAGHHRPRHHLQRHRRRGTRGHRRHDGSRAGAAARPLRLQDRHLLPPVLPRVDRRPAHPDLHRARPRHAPGSRPPGDRDERDRGGDARRPHRQLEARRLRRQRRLLRHRRRAVRVHAGRDHAVGVRVQRRHPADHHDADRRRRVHLGRAGRRGPDDLALQHPLRHAAVERGHLRDHHDPPAPVPAHGHHRAVHQAAAGQREERVPAAEPGRDARVRHSGGGGRIHRSVRDAGGAAGLHARARERGAGRRRTGRPVRRPRETASGSQGTGAAQDPGRLRRLRRPPGRERSLAGGADRTDRGPDRAERRRQDDLVQRDQQAAARFRRPGLAGRQGHHRAVTGGQRSPGNGAHLPEPAHLREHGRSGERPRRLSPAREGGVHLWRVRPAEAAP